MNGLGVIRSFYIARGSALEDGELSPCLEIVKVHKWLEPILLLRHYPVHFNYYYHFTFVG